MEFLNQIIPAFVTVIPFLLHICNDLQNYPVCIPTCESATLMWAFLTAGWISRSISHSVPLCLDFVDEVELLINHLAAVEDLRSQSSFLTSVCYSLHVNFSNLGKSTHSHPPITVPTSRRKHTDYTLRDSFSWSCWPSSFCYRPCSRNSSQSRWEGILDFSNLWKV